MAKIINIFRNKTWARTFNSVRDICNHTTHVSGDTKILLHAGNKLPNNMALYARRL
jgi:hypothetical protein